MDAEQAYLFRHALVRDAAYDLQLPADRARLHGLALALLEALHTDDQRGHLAAELAEHAEKADDPALRATILKYTWLAAEFARSKRDPAALRWLDAAAQLETDPVQRARALQQAADLLLITGSADEGRGRLESALLLARETESRQLQGSVLHTLAVTHQVRGRFAEAEARHREALEIAREVGDTETEAMAITNLAGLRRSLGSSAEAFELQNQALALHRASGNRRGESVALGNVVVYLFDAGLSEEALATGAQALALADETGNRRTAGIVRGNMGMILTGLGRLAEAEANYSAALVLHREVYNRPYEAFDRCRYALVILRLGDERRAREEWRRGHEQMLAYGDVPDLAITLPDMRAACEAAGVAPFDATSGTA